MASEKEARWTNENQIARAIAMMPTARFNRMEIHVQADKSLVVSLRGQKHETGEMLPAVALRLLAMEKKNAT